MPNNTGTRLYIGRLPPNVQEKDVEDLFKGYGKITDLRLMGTFGFAEWARAEDAEDVLKDFNGKPFMGENLKIEFAKESRKNQARGAGGYGAPPPPGYGGYGGGYGGGYYDYYGGYGGYGPPPGGRGGYGPPPPGYGPPPPHHERGGGRRDGPQGGGGGGRRGQFRLIVSNLPANTSWQDLKDLGREHGRISFADVDPQRPDEGVIEYDNREDFERALDRIEGVDMRGNKLRIDPAPEAAASRGGPPPPNDDRPPPPARDRSRSPAPRRRGDDEERDAPPPRRYDSRSPPRRERDYD